MKFTVAIDGPAAAGKGTVSRAVSAHYGFAHLDTGLLYRAVGAGVLNGGEAVEVARNLDPSDLDDDTLRTQAVADAASQVAVDPDVRAALVAFQRQFAQRDGGAVLDGRDIGTVICPQADVKLYITASAETRANRRFSELSEKGFSTSFQEVLSEVIDRDRRDSERATAPLMAAADAVTIDTSDLSIEDAVAAAVAAVAAKIPAH